MHKILTIIPARGGSKGVPGKNKKMLLDFPLINYTIDTALKCPLISEVLVSTDDESIAEISLRAGASVPFLRPTQFATDTAPTIDVVRHAINYLSDAGKSYDALCLLQPTVPFRNEKDLEECIEVFLNGDLDSLFTVREVPHQYHPRWVFTAKDENTLKPALPAQSWVTRRQDLEKCFHRDGSVYLTKMDVVQKHNSLYGEKMGYFVMAKSPDINIDLPADFKKAEKFLSENPNWND